MPRKGVLEQMLNEDELLHYSSKYYDPVKAHEYYMKNRKLKGRQPAKQTTAQKQREGSAYVSAQINKQKTEELEKLDKETEKKATSLQGKAQETVDRITEKVQAAVDAIKAKGDVINTIPSDASPALKAFLEGQNRRIKATAANRTAKEVREANAEIAKITKSLREALSKAREDYLETKKAAITKYKNLQTSELKNIRDKVR